MNKKMLRIPLYKTKYLGLIDYHCLNLGMCQQLDIGEIYDSKLRMHIINDLE